VSPINEGMILPLGIQEVDTDLLLVERIEPLGADR
jgi:hypothetical protein